MVDRLESLLGHFPITARLLPSAVGANASDSSAVGPQLHLISDGSASVVHDNGEVLRIVEPSVLLYPRAQPLRVVMDAGQQASLLSAHLRFDAGDSNPLADALPPRVCMPLAALQGSDALLGMLFEEANAQRCGRQAVLDRLLEVVIIQVLRMLMENGQIQVGLLAGMAHPRLRHALVAMHEQPSTDWSLQALAEHAGMSRSAFAEGFRTVVGSTPGHYLQAWRTRLVQQALRRGHSLKRIAPEVGYASEAALSRAFKAHTGHSPRQWKQHDMAVPGRGDLPASP